MRGGEVGVEDVQRGFEGGVQGEGGDGGAEVGGVGFWAGWEEWWGVGG